MMEMRLGGDGTFSNMPSGYVLSQVQNHEKRILASNTESSLAGLKPQYRKVSQSSVNARRILLVPESSLMTFGLPDSDEPVDVERSQETLLPLSEQYEMGDSDKLLPTDLIDVPVSQEIMKIIRNAYKEELEYDNSGTHDQLFPGLSIWYKRKACFYGCMNVSYKNLKYAFAFGLVGFCLSCLIWGGNLYVDTDNDPDIEKFLNIVFFSMTFLLTLTGMLAGMGKYCRAYCRTGYIGNEKAWLERFHHEVMPHRHPWLMKLLGGDPYSLIYTGEQDGELGKILDAVYRVRNKLSQYGAAIAFAREVEKPIEEIEQYFQRLPSLLAGYIRLAKERHSANIQHSTEPELEEVLTTRRSRAIRMLGRPTNVSGVIEV